MSPAEDTALALALRLDPRAPWMAFRCSQDGMDALTRNITDADLVRVLKMMDERKTAGRPSVEKLAQDCANSTDTTPPLPKRKMERGGGDRKSKAQDCANDSDTTPPLPKRKPSLWGLRQRPLERKVALQSSPIPSPWVWAIAP